MQGVLRAAIVYSVKVTNGGLRCDALLLPSCGRVYIFGLCWLGYRVFGVFVGGNLSIYMYNLRTRYLFYNISKAWCVTGIYGYVE